MTPCQWSVFLHLKMLKSAPKCPKLIPETIKLWFSGRNSVKIGVYDKKSPNSVKNWWVPNNVIERPEGGGSGEKLNNLVSFGLTYFCYGPGSPYYDHQNMSSCIGWQFRNLWFTTSNLKTLRWPPKGIRSASNKLGKHIICCISVFDWSVDCKTQPYYETEICPKWKGHICSKIHPGGRTGNQWAVISRQILTIKLFKNVKMQVMTEYFGKISIRRNNTKRLSKFVIFLET
jgi:hypothetical protein